MSSILIVDDDPAICEIFTEFLSGEGYIVRSAPGGSECMGSLQDSKPDLVVLDIMMQPMDGWETLTAIRNNSATKEIPVAMFSGKLPTLQEIEHYGRWIEDYLMKPMSFDAISGTLSGIIERGLILRSETEFLKGRGTEQHIIEDWSGLTRSLRMKKKFSVFSPQGLGIRQDEIDELEKRLKDLRQTLSLPVQTLP